MFGFGCCSMTGFSMPVSSAPSPPPPHRPHPYAICCRISTTSRGQSAFVFRPSFLLFSFSFWFIYKFISLKHIFMVLNSFLYTFRFYSFVLGVFDFLCTIPPYTYMLPSSLWWDADGIDNGCCLVLYQKGMMSNMKFSLDVLSKRRVLDAGICDWDKRWRLMEGQRPRRLKIFWSIS